jgi:carboxyl-terminal processing protease
MKLQPRILLAVIVSIVTGIILGVSLDLKVHSRNFSENTDEFHMDMDAFESIVKRIRESYVTPLDEEVMLRDAVKGVMRGLDKHSVYLGEKAWSKLKTQSTGQFGGVGIKLAIDTDAGHLRVVNPIDNTPADRAGILAGDVLVHIDHKPIEKNALSFALAKLRGKPGTPVSLGIERADQDQALEFDLIRAAIDVSSVRSRWLGDFAYISISQFQVDTGAEVIREVEELLADPDHHMQGLIIDLRGNSGGVLQASVEMADAFLTEGKIVYTEGRRVSSQVKYNASATDILDGLPIAILIDEGSASASEIVAGALQDHKRAVLMGSKSFGKGSVQTVMPLRNKHAIKLTTALYYTPKGRVINEVGLVPDILIEPDSNQDYLDLVVDAFAKNLVEKKIDANQ